MSLTARLIGLIARPVADLIDSLHTSQEEKLAAHNKWAEIQASLFQTALEHETELVKAQSKVIHAEATGVSWLQRSWRPLLMLAIILIIVNNYIVFPYAAAMGFKLVVLDLPAGLWALLTAGVSGYVVGRSAEKIIPNTKWAKEESE